MLVNIRAGTKIRVDGKDFIVTKIGTPLSAKQPELRIQLEFTDAYPLEHNLIIYAPVAADGSSLQDALRVLNHKEEENA